MGKLAVKLKRVERRMRRIVCERRCARQADPLENDGGLIVSTFYDVEGDYARPGETPNEIESVARILEIEKRYGIRSTYNVVARFALDAPELMSEIERSGNEIASHSYDHRILTGLGRAEIADNLRRTKHTFADLGIEIAGHRSPQSDWDHRVLDALVDQGYEWSVENGSEPHPYRIRQKGEHVLWRFAAAHDDWAYESERLRPAAMLERWRHLIRDAVGRRSHLAIGFHAWVELAQGRLATLDEFFHWLVEQDGVRVLPFRDVLGIMRQPANDRAVVHG